MPFARLREVLQARFMVSVNSEQAVANEVQAKATSRAKAFAAKGKKPPNPKQAQIVAGLPATSLEFRAIDVLRKIGELTTPQWANMARLSSSWATRRYLWAIAQPRRAPARFRLNSECRDLDFHQKTLMSDEFGVGFAGLVMERLFNTDAWVDTSVALADSARYQDVRRRGRLQPDYLMWQDLTGAPFYVVECKGSQSQRAVSIGQIRRGLEQVPSLRFANGARPVERFVIATLMQASGTTVFIMDPPDDETPEQKERRQAAEKSERTSEKLDENVYFIRDLQEFERNAWDAQRAQLLKWAGQYRSAAEVEASIEIAPRERPMVDDRPLTSVIVGNLVFDGFRVPLFPEVLGPELSIFTGVERDILQTARHERDTSRKVASGMAPRFREFHDHEDEAQGFLSIGSSGTCLIIEGAGRRAMLGQQGKSNPGLLY